MLPLWSHKRRAMPGSVSSHLLFCCSLPSAHLKAEAQVWTRLGIVNIFFAVGSFDQYLSGCRGHTRKYPLCQQKGCPFAEQKRSRGVNCSLSPECCYQPQVWLP